MKKFNFCAGPATLPKTVFEQMGQAAINYKDTGLSLLEISHRTPMIEGILDETESLIRALYYLSDDYAVLFLTGGASMQFCSVPFNLLPDDGVAAYLDTGKWSVKAIKEAKLFGKTVEVASSKDKNYTYVPKTYEVPQNATYFHITTNNTIYGTQLKDIPKATCPIIADMSSDIFAKPLDVSPFGLIYAGAQKNVGPAGITLVIVRKDLLGKVKRNIPTMLDYRTHIAKKSMFNTPPVYAIYGCCLTLRWVKEQGLVQLQQKNKAKAKLLYDEIDQNPLFEGTVVKEDRSIMNVPFVLTKPELTDSFLAATTSAGCIGLKGHRSVGGCRASLYNAMTLEGVQTLIDVMQEFKQLKG